MRVFLLVSAVALLIAAQWALHPTVGYRGWAITTTPSVPVSLSAAVQLLPSPFWQEWIVGNWTTAFVLGGGCSIQAGPMRGGIYVNGTAYVETPAVSLGQNFTVAVSFKPRYGRSDYGRVWLWRKDGSYWWGEASATYESSSGTFFRVADSSGQGRVASGDVGSDFLTLIYVGMHIVSQNTYYMQIYLNGRLIAQMTFSGQRGGVSNSAFRLGGGGVGADQQLWIVAFAAYSRALSATEVAVWRPDAPVGGSLLMYYYAHPQFVRDVNNDGVLDWLDLSGNSRNARLRGGASLQWFVEPVALWTQQCGGVALTAQWDGFTATYAVNGTSRSVYEPGKVYFDGATGYAVIPITVYGWQGLTIEQYIYAPPAQKGAYWHKFSCIGSWGSGQSGPGICAESVQNRLSVSDFGVSFNVRVGDSLTGTWKSYAISLPTGRWQHVAIAYSADTRTLRFYVNGTLMRAESLPSTEYTILDVSPSASARFQRFVLAANSDHGERTQMAYAYVRIYSHALAEQEILHNYQNPNSPATHGLEVWLHWDSFRGSQWLDKSGKGRHATVHGTVFAYPHWQWTVGAYLQHGYPVASPLVATDFRFGDVSWTSGSSRGGAVQLVRVGGAYVDAAAYSGSGWSVSRYVAPNAAFGFDAVWTPSDDYRGWISLWRVGATFLNITQMGGHGVSLNSTAVSASAGTAAAVLGVGLYVNGTRRAPAALGANATSFSLLPSAQGGLRALIRYAWLDAGVRYGVNSSQTYGDAFGRAYVATLSPSPWAYYIDFRWWPPVATWGILQNPPITAAVQRNPNQILAPAVVSGRPQVSASLWGPFGEICLAQGNVAFGVRYVWIGTSASTCVFPATYSTGGSVQTNLFNATVPIQLYFTDPPIQHPHVANSVPNARFCSANATDFLVPYLPVKTPGSTVVSDQWACAPSDYAPSGYYLAQAQRGWALIAPVMRVFRINTTSVVYAGSSTAVLARGAAVPAMSARSADGRTWHIYTSDGRAVATVSLQTPPNVPSSGGVVSAVFGVPRSLSTLLSVWWSGGTKYYVTAAGLASDPVVYVASFTGSPVSVYAELNAPLGYSYHLAVLDNGTYVWGVAVSGSSFTAYVPTPGYYTVRLYRDGVKVWEKLAYLSPDAKLTVGPIEVAVFTPVAPVSLYTPAAPKPPVFVPAVTMEMPPYAVGILLLGVFVATYVTMREVSLASLITGAIVIVFGVLMSVPIYGVAGVFLLAFGLWNKARRQGSV
jgi:hypothetical protein